MSEKGKKKKNKDNHKILLTTKKVYALNAYVHAFMNDLRMKQTLARR